ncbi:methyltransferase [Geomicrobium sp. JCM 19037]|uniref:class I SAM-dependent methyltransferase n=1 Tax=Geomicrobium sp. JCM 19037 TaxID=1460634 RepID=UPI00045F2161|nr:class I SAM-dependent methyltransferase [Geomicrobium sp. JCM 19037]GAK05390.1 methyltransferase [Geomicrobium sp. JCM 19037]
MIEQNQKAWDQKVKTGAAYTHPVSSEAIQKAKEGDWNIHITVDRPVPKQWFPSSLYNVKILCLASGGGQQGPILAAAGADVTVFDLSDNQLAQDRYVAERDGLMLKTIQGEMSNLSSFTNESFDIIVHPVSNVFVEDIQPVWQECARVLKKGGTLIAGFTHPFLYVFDDEEEERGRLKVRHSVPTNSIAHLSEVEKNRWLEQNNTVEYAHTLEDQLQGQIDAGFSIIGFYEDDFGGTRLIDQHIKSFAATRAVKNGV